MRLAHKLCNREDFAWRDRITRMIQAHRSLEEMAEELNRVGVRHPNGAGPWTAHKRARHLRDVVVPFTVCARHARGNADGMDTRRAAPHPRSAASGRGRGWRSRSRSANGSGRAAQAALAAAIAYYGFFSLFPLLLVLASLAGFALRDHPDLQQRLLDSAFAQFPVVGAEIRGNVRSIQGSGVRGRRRAGARDVGRARRDPRDAGAMDTVWDVPRARRPGALASIGLSLVTLALLGVFLLAARRSPASQPRPARPAPRSAWSPRSPSMSRSSCWRIGCSPAPTSAGERSRPARPLRGSAGRCCSWSAPGSSPGGSPPQRACTGVSRS